jgi:hypothetical protein
MPIAAYCKKCKLEVTPGPMCPHCGQKLSANSLRLSWAYEYAPARDFLSWSAILRIALPVVVLLLLAAVGTEWAAKGFLGVQTLLKEGLLPLILEIAGAMGLVILFVLMFRGREEVRYVLDHTGAHAAFYMVKPPILRRWLRLLSEPAEEDMLGRPIWKLDEKHVPWQALKRVQLWPDKDKILLHSPRWWVALVVHCQPDTYDDALRFMQTQLKKRTGVLPPLPPPEDYNSAQL